MIKKLIEIEGLHCENCAKNEEVDDLLIADVVNGAGHYKVKDVTEIS